MASLRASTAKSGRHAATSCPFPVLSRNSAKVHLAVQTGRLRIQRHAVPSTPEIQCLLGHPPTENPLFGHLPKFPALAVPLSRFRLLMPLTQTIPGCVEAVTTTARHMQKE